MTKQLVLGLAGDLVMPRTPKGSLGVTLTRLGSVSLRITASGHTYESIELGCFCPSYAWPDRTMADAHPSPYHIRASDFLQV